jgi:F420-non-reducing hydrogenase iron-sulfur subunit
MKEEFTPKILGFLCNWCSYAGADLAGVSRLQMPPSLRTVRVMCSSRVDSLFVLLSFLKGADAVMIGGCHPGDCHYNRGNYLARRRFALVKKVFESLGLEGERIKLKWIAASEGPAFAAIIEEYTEKIKKIGPNPLKEEVFL